MLYIPTKIESLRFALMNIYVEVRFSLRLFYGLIKLRDHIFSYISRDPLIFAVADEVNDLLVSMT